MSRMPPEVVHIITGLQQGGAESMLHKLLTEARQQNPEIRQSVYALGQSGVVGERLSAQGFEVRALGLSPRLGNPWVLRPLWQHLRRLPSDSVVQTWMYHGDLIGGLLAYAAGQRRIVWNIRQSGIGPADIGRLTRGVVSLCARLSHWLPRRIITNARTAEAVHVAAGYAASRFTWIGNGFDTQRFCFQPEGRRRVREQLGVPDQALLIGNVARHDPQKDLGNFVAMARQVHQHHSHTRFLIAGRGVPSSGALRAQIAAAGLEQAFLLLDEQQDVPALMCALDLFCLSSRAEGFPNVLGEAMACERPCVSSDCGDAGAVLGDPRWIAPTGDPEALAGRVCTLLALPAAQRQQLGTGHRQRIQSSFSVASIWRDYLHLYRSL